MKAVLSGQGVGSVSRKRVNLHVFILFPKLIISYIFYWLNTYPIHQWMMDEIVPSETVTYNIINNE